MLQIRYLHRKFFHKNRRKCQ